MFLICNGTFARNIDSLIDFGDSLFERQDYISALNEYQRALFFSESDDKSFISNKIADCHLFLKEYNIACAYYDSTYNYAETDSLRIELRFKKIQCYILEKDFGYALLKLKEPEFESSEYFKLKKALFQGVSYFGLNQFDDAYRSFNVALSKGGYLKTEQLRQLFNEKKSNKPYPVLAAIMSMVIPGSGQIYVGKTHEGINSFFLLSGLTLLCYYAPGLSAITVPFIYRYYIGGILNAIKYAGEKRKFKQYCLYNDIMFLFPENDYFKNLFSIGQKENDYSKYIEEPNSDIDRILSITFLLYKKYFSSQDMDVCIFEPSCSVYMMESINRNGVFNGFLDGLDRLLRCHPFATRNDYQVNKLSQKYEDDF